MPSCKAVREAVTRGFSHVDIHFSISIEDQGRFAMRAKHRLLLPLDHITQMDIICGMNPIAFNHTGKKD
jgi:hypothetical protein